MAGKKVLVVDDEKLIVKGIRFSLEQDNMEVDCAYDGEEALQMAHNKEYDIILLDVMLPKLTGFEVCQQIREFSNVPVIMLTAKGDDMDKILGLEYGADDYTWAHGVGSCIMGAIDRPALTKLLALPEKIRLCCMVALGYPTHKSHLVEMQNGSVKYYLDEAGDYCVPKRPLSKVLLKTL